MLYEGAKPGAVVTLTRLTIGCQWRGQALGEFIFFGTDADPDEFTQGNDELGARASTDPDRGVNQLAGLGFGSPATNGYCSK